MDHFLYGAIFFFSKLNSASYDFIFLQEVKVCDCYPLKKLKLPAESNDKPKASNETKEMHTQESVCVCFFFI